MRSTRLIVAIFILFVVNASRSFAQPDQNDVRIQEGPGGKVVITSTNTPPANRVRVAPGTHVPTDKYALLFFAEIQKDLGVTEEQKAKLVELRKKTNASRRDMLKNVPNPTFVREAISALRKEESDAIAEILRESQVSRLEQLQRQMQVRNEGVLAFTRETFDDELLLTPKQKLQLKTEQESAKKELARRIEELRKQLNNEIEEKVLTDEQQKKLGRLLGRPLEVD